MITGVRGTARTVPTLGDGVSARAGVLTGEAAVTLGATNQGMVAGDLVNTAARLQSAAAPGTVLVGETTARAAGNAIAFEAAGEQALKGKAAPVPPWRALRVIAERGGRNRAEGLEAPFVGRDAELGLLKELFHATEREGRVRLVSVTGIGGIGKSRLAWELEKYMDGITGTIWWHRGRSPAYGEGISFWSLGEMVRARAGLAEGDDERTTRERIAALLDSVALDGADRHWIEVALLTLLGVETSADPAMLFGAWRTFFERLAADAPVVLVFEDLHWADPGTLDFIEHLLEWSRAAPIYVVTLARPELLERRPAWGTGRRSFTSLPVEPLPEASMRALVTGLVRDLPEPAIQAIVARSEGVPFYAVETVRMLIADGRLAQRVDGSFEPIGDLTDLHVPETLTALIASRLDRLDTAERSILLDAAVLGQSFTVAALASVSGLDLPALERPLATLVRRELLMHDVDPRSPERGQYAFVQGLIREVAYHTLARKDRKSRHLAAARYFESTGSDEIAAALVGHYLAAREGAPEGPERDALAAQARVALRGAAERAASTADHDGAMRFFDQGVALWPEAVDRAELLERAAEEALTAGHFAAAEQRAREAVELRRGLGDRPALARSVTTLARVLIGDFRTRAAAETIEPILAELEDLLSDPAVIALRAELARALMLIPAGEPGPVLELADAVLAAAEHVDQGPVIADVLITKGSVLTFVGRIVEGLAVMRGGIAHAERLGLSREVLRGYNNVAASERPIDPRGCVETARAGLALTRRRGDRHFEPLLLNHLQTAGLRTGDWQAVAEELDATVAANYEGTGRALILSAVRWLRAHRGEPFEDIVEQEEALARTIEDMEFRRAMEADIAAIRAFSSGSVKAMRPAWALLRSIPGYESDPGLWSTVARLALWDSDPAAARVALDGLIGTGAHGPAVEADRATFEAGIAALEGRRAEALPMYRAALEAWRENGCRWDEARCGLDMALLLDSSDPDVSEVAERSGAIFAAIGAKPDLARLEQAHAKRELTASRSSNPVEA